MKVALLEASHWHAPLYLGALRDDPDVEVVAVSDAVGARGREIAETFGARFHQSWAELLRTEPFDFAFAFGRHCDMRAIGEALAALGRPFALEKPGGMNAAGIAELRRLSADRNLYVATPLVFEFSEILGALRRLANAPGAAAPTWRHLSFRFIAGPAHRYLEADCAWMLDPKLSGGGCGINLAPHFVDLAHRLTGDRVAAVSARMFRDPQVADVEIYARINLEMEGGAHCTIETGYTYPGGTAEQRDFSFSLAADRFYVRSDESGFRFTPDDGSPATHVALGLETDAYYRVFVQRALEEVRAGRSPTVGLDDMERVMTVIDCAYASDLQGGRSVPLGAAPIADAAQGENL